ncbi:MAG: YsnF/AvaK domain-containing protein [Thermoproteota archaeon]|nr:YsnF/AvaK domain-containing protein [Thermoproteota archaeon]
MTPDNHEEINWNDVTGKEAMGENGLDLGTIIEVKDEYVITEMGGISKKIYYLPKSAAKYFNGVFLNFSLTDTQLSAFEQGRENIDLYRDSLSGSTALQPKQEQEKEETVIPLIEEDLNVTKKIIEDKVKIVKDALKETKTVQIELVHERVTIERIHVNYNNKTLNNKTNSDLNSAMLYEKEMNKETDVQEPTYSKTEFLIPIKREEPVITKRSLIREELLIKKKPVTETKRITEEVLSEKIEYDAKK